MTGTMLDRWTAQRACEPGSSTCGTQTLSISSDRFDSSVCWINGTYTVSGSNDFWITSLILWGLLTEEWPCLCWCWEQPTAGGSASSGGGEARLWRSGALRHPHLALAGPAWGAASGSRADQQEPLADVDIHVYSNDAEYRRIIAICQIDFYPGTVATNLTRTHTHSNTHSNTLTNTDDTTLRLCSKWKQRVRVAEKTRRTEETLWWPCCSASRCWRGSILLQLSNNDNQN